MYSYEEIMRLRNKQVQIVYSNEIDVQKKLRENLENSFEEIEMTVEMVPSNRNGSNLTKTRFSKQANKKLKFRHMKMLKTVALFIEF